jgi:hypothetical protein
MLVKLFRQFGDYPGFLGAVGIAEYRIFNEFDIGILFRK